MRRRLDDQGSIARKTQTQVVQLADSIAALVDNQRRRTRRLNLNSFVAYVLFTILVGSGFFALYRSRANELVEARDHALAERDASKKRADDATTQAAAREQADGKAWEVYQLLEAGKRVEARDKLAALRDLPLSRTERAILTTTAHETQVVATDAALKTAIASFKAGRYAEMIVPLETALAGEPAGARAGQMHYYLGIAYAKENELDKAVTHLQAAAASDVDQEDARFQLASALDRAGQYPRARSEYDRFATAHPQSQLAVFAMRRSATLARMPTTPAGVGGTVVVPKPAAGSSAPTPVPSPTPTPKPVVLAPTPTPAPTPAAGTTVAPPP
ncbi:MAG: hypothetical protein NT062_11755 [Proteobacteria bacterium]|nr:hypothetical protein [Pseudomonadota bacterium]